MKRLLPIILVLLAVGLAFAEVANTPAQGRQADAPIQNTPSPELYFLQGKWSLAASGYEGVLEPSVNDLFMLGRAYFHMDDLERSRETFQRAIRLGENEESRIYLALIEAVRSKRKIKDLEKMLDSMGHNPVLWRAIGMAHLIAGQYEKALGFFRGAIERDQNDYMSYFYMGHIYELREDFDNSISFYKNSVKINPNFAQALNNLGYGYKEKHYYTYAIEMYSKAIEVMPDNAGFHYNIGNAYTHKGLIRKAFDSYKRAVALEPQFAKAHFNLGRTYVKLGMLRKGLKELKLYIEYWTPNLNPRDVPLPEAVEEEIEELEDLIKEVEASGKETE